MYLVLSLGMSRMLAQNLRILLFVFATTILSITAAVDAIADHQPDPGTGSPPKIDYESDFETDEEDVMLDEDTNDDIDENVAAQEVKVHPDVGVTRGAYTAANNGDPSRPAHRRPKLKEKLIRKAVADVASHLVGKVQLPPGVSGAIHGAIATIGGDASTRNLCKEVGMTVGRNVAQDIAIVCGASRSVQDQIDELHGSASRHLGISNPNTGASSSSRRGPADSTSRPPLSFVETLSIMAAAYKARDEGKCSEILDRVGMKLERVDRVREWDLILVSKCDALERSLFVGFHGVRCSQTLYDASAFAMNQVPEEVVEELNRIVNNWRATIGPISVVAGHSADGALAFSLNLDENVCRIAFSSPNADHDPVTNRFSLIANNDLVMRQVDRFSGRNCRRLLVNGLYRHSIGTILRYAYEFQRDWNTIM